jgi:nucleoside phosphorylase
MTIQEKRARGQQQTVFVFAPTPNEYRAAVRHVEAVSFKNFRTRVIKSGPGKINAAFQVAAALGRAEKAGEKALFVVGAGTAGSLSMTLAGGDLIISSSALIADWLMEDDEGRRYGAYGRFVYEKPGAETAAAMSLDCADPRVERLGALLAVRGFKRGRLLTSDAFVAGRNHKLALGRDFEALACDMESGAFAYAAGVLLNLPWFNLRVVADTLDDALADYFKVEKDMVEILGRGLAETLTALDEIL